MLEYKDIKSKIVTDNVTEKANNLLRKQKKSWNKIDVNDPVDDLRKGINIFNNQLLKPTYLIFSPNSYKWVLQFLSKIKLKK